MVHHKIIILCIQREILTGSRDPSQHEEVYRGILGLSPMRPIDSKMVCQLIPKFFLHFPQLARRALEVYFDLCEDDDVAVRQEAIKGLPQLCGEIQQYVLHARKYKSTFLNDKIKNLQGYRLRLLYFFGALQAYVKTLEDVLQKKEKDEENTVEIVTKTISNIKILIKQFFRNPPSQKTSGVLSFLGTENPSAKRKATSADRTSKIFKGHYGQRVHRPRMFLPKVPKYRRNPLTCACPDSANGPLIM
ncbi:unnamed protein product [Nezara viridula]|uniref:Uncharacterized protein n=1 Tax=Nezara viridula TaxID=85310 RepID=A0A9P0E9J8_NEZVI|nr:unnamed protein product [Nezara viridula]CAH1394702.1 unnamed protein product [Nezara viridula]